MMHRRPALLGSILVVSRCVTAYQAGPKRLFLQDKLVGDGSDR